MTGYLATSKAGHDKRQVYVIIKEETEYVYLADGKTKTVSNPKKKNKKHIQVIKKIQSEENNGVFSDLEIKRTIKKYLDKEDN